MLVDDHPLVRDGLRLRLEVVSHIEVMGEADDGETAVALLQQLDADPQAHLPDLILMDLNMRKMSGLALATLLHERWPQIAVLVLSMHDNVEYMMQAMRAGVRGYLLKDEPAQEILVAIEQVMAGRNHLSPTVAMKLAQASLPTTLLSPREREILRHVAAGSANKQIAQTLNLSVRTIETHRQNIKRKLGIDGQAEFVKYAVEHRGV
ncbi:response regulator transcription factor [Alcaligenaceae bacterium A4P071]|nr:response regulator transcription factor [Alcaligenaceae bacterium B3P038]MDQ2147989.1 response regulator transcription factor [Alcaligenaceae bacterium C4P045]MDQ2185333.1 response regulator transcription factor [Alcaligenaceae bacterium A4P071]